jgi:serine/threonine-protein kinase
MTSFQDRTQDESVGFIGQVIGGNFRIDRLIGSGATGNVYQAEQLSLGKAVAVKVLHPHLMGDDKLVRRFQREAKSASRLNHPNSVQIIDSGQDRDGTLYIAMELLSGRDLAEVIRDEFPLPLPRMIHIMAQVFAALDEAHAHGLIHRDLKPSNIMLIERRDEPDFVKVCDYGIAKSAADDAQPGGEAQMLTVQGLVCGTPEYMSPEQARGEPLDGRTDLYSAAVILYQMTTGDVPFRAATPIGIVSRHLSEAPIVPSRRRADASIPPLLDDLILRGLAKSRDLRPATAAIFRDELQKVATTVTHRRALANAETLSLTGPGSSGTTIPAKPPTGATAALGRSTRGRLAVGLGGAAIAALLAIGIARRTGAPAAPVRHHQVQVAPLPTSPPPSTPVAATVVAPPAQAEVPVQAQAAIAPAAPAQDQSPRGSAVAGASPDRTLRRRTTGPRPVAASPAARRPSAAAPEPISQHAVRGPDTPALDPSAPTIAAAARAQTATSRESPGGLAEDKPSGLAAGRAPQDSVADGERLLAQGEVAEACRRGEVAKRAAPRAAAVYKFLGKCYMRAGDVALAKENYRRYLDVAPNAPDAVFIESMIK